MLPQSGKSCLVLLLFLILQFVIHTGAIRKKDDPILNTQTGPISWKQKQEEIKDGEKGAPAPSFRFYKKEDFKVKDPMEVFAEGESSHEREGHRIPGYGEPIPEDLEGEGDEYDSWWNESWDDATDEQALRQSYWEEDW